MDIVLEFAMFNSGRESASGSIDRLLKYLFLKFSI